MRKGPIVMIIGLIITIILLTSCSKQTSNEVNKADQTVYTYIKASLEGDDDLYKTVLVKDAQSSLEPHYLAFPNLTKKMKNRYIIKRFSHHLSENKLYYYIEYYHPENKQNYAYNLLMIKDAKGNWKSTSITGISSKEMKSAIKGYENEGVLVHSYNKERN